MPKIIVIGDHEVINEIRAAIKRCTEMLGAGQTDERSVGKNYDLSTPRLGLSLHSDGSLVLS
jgi:hypothetical protein